MGNIVSREFEILKETQECENCVKLLDVFYTVTEDQKYIQNLVFEYVPDNLDRYLTTKFKLVGGLSPLEIRSLMRQLFSALQFLHSRSIIHRDLKPENILIDSSMDPATLKLCDFGSAKKRNKINTPYIVSRFYRAPELMCCNSVYGTEVDLWAAGCIFAELYTGKPLFAGKDEGDQFIKVIKLLGAPTVEELETLLRSAKLPAAMKNSVPKLGVKVALDSIFEADPQPQAALNLLEGLLHYTPSERLTAQECLAHPYFQV
jgi:glycogen synthase kinase 3 beta